MGRPMIDLTGQRFGSWTVHALERATGHRTWWSVRCDCGFKTTIRSDSLRTGSSLQCAPCAAAANRRRHGATGSPTYVSWQAMRNRCLSENHADFPNYGGRGIRICPEWDGYERFLADMGERPSGMTLDRIDPNGDYGPENCRWATAKEQARNQRKTLFLEANGKRQSLSAWAEELGYSHIMLYKRYAAGWPHDAIVNTPKRLPTDPKPRGRRPHHPSNAPAT